MDNIHPELRARIYLGNVAVSSRPGKATFSLDRSLAGLSSLTKRDLSPGHGVEAAPVRIATLDQLMKGRRTFGTIDIEGAEYNAFCGGAPLVRDHPVIAFEFDAYSSA
jgi:FkbM family methyltransferase